MASPTLAQQQAQDPELQGVRGRAAVSIASLELAGKAVSVRYHPQPAEGLFPWNQLERLRDGAVLAFDRAAALRLRTEIGLRFGDTVIETENHAPRYPGVYSIWLKRTRSGWNLVFNSQPDIWGTQHDAAHDVAEVPLAWHKLESSAKRMAIELRKNGESAAQLRIAWGAHEWTAGFTAAAAKTAK